MATGERLGNGPLFLLITFPKKIHKKFFCVRFLLYISFSKLLKGSANNRRGYTPTCTVLCGSVNNFVNNFCLK